MAKKSIISYLSDFGATIVGGIEDCLVLEGRVFTISKRFSLDSENTTYIIFDMSACTSDIVTIYPIVLKAFGAGPITTDIYLNPTFTAGTEIESINRNFESSNVACAKVYLNTTVTAEGTKAPPEYYCFSDGVGASSDIGGDASTGLTLNLNKGDVYMLKITNTSATENALLQIHASWVEMDRVN